MLTIRYSKRFKRDWKREKSGLQGKNLQSMLSEVLEILEGSQPFPHRYHDHALSGEWKDHRDCHLKPDLVMIYRRNDDHSIDLVRLGSHSELGL